MKRVPEHIPRAAESGASPASEPGYYGLPALKASHYKWMVAIYIFVAGIAGSAHILGAIVAVTDEVAAQSRLLAHIRYIAVGCVAFGTALLIADLKTPRRFFNMLRIFRATSPMSFGSYVFTAFGSLCGVLAGLQLLADLDFVWVAPHWLMLALQFAAALLGVLMCSYTAPLLSATSTPLWSAAPAWLAASFAAFSFASSAGALTLTGTAFDPEGARTEVSRIGYIATAAAAVMTAAWVLRVRSFGIASPLLKGALAFWFWGGVVLVGLVVPLGLAAVSVIAGSHAVLALAIASTELTGSLLWRYVLLVAGNESALRPGDYFELARRAA